MIVRLDEDAAASLEDADDFRRFKIAVNAQAADFERIEKACPRGVAFLDTKNALVAPSFVAELAPTSDRDAWIEKFEDMLAKSRQHGWISENGMIKSHVDWEAGSSIE